MEERLASAWARSSGTRVARHMCSKSARLDEVPQLQRKFSRGATYQGSKGKAEVTLSASVRQKRRMKPGPNVEPGTVSAYNRQSTVGVGYRHRFGGLILCGSLLGSGRLAGGGGGGGGSGRPVTSSANAASTLANSASVIRRGHSIRTRP
jgi:hypothetical protein